MRLLLMFALVAALAACGQPDQAQLTSTAVAGCQSDAATYEAAVRPLLARWKDGVDLAMASPRMSLAAPIAELQTIRRDTNALNVPVCLTDGHKLIIDGMDGRIASMTAFLSNSGDDTSLAAALLEQAYFDDFELHMTSAKTGQPIPTDVPATPTSEPRALKLTSADLKTLLWQDDMSGLIAQDGGGTILKGFIDKATLTLSRNSTVVGAITLASYNTTAEAETTTQGYTVDPKGPTIWLKDDAVLVVRCGLVADIQLKNEYARSAHSFAYVLDKRIQERCQ